jgi:hypothetical protein
MPTGLRGAAIGEPRELVRLRQLLLHDFGDRRRQPHRVVDLGFPGFTSYVKGRDSEFAKAILHDCPTAAVECSVGRHHGETYRVHVFYACKDLDTLRRRLGQLDRDIENSLSAHEVGALLTTSNGIDPNTDARLLAGHHHLTEKTVSHRSPLRGLSCLGRLSRGSRWPLRTIPPFGNSGLDHS